MSKTSMEEILAHNGRLVYSSVGDSMYPLIRQGRDLLVVERPKRWNRLPEGTYTEKLKKYEIALYKRDNGKAYVLHRVLSVRNDDYVICGDNRWCCERGINDRHIIGVLTAVIRNGKEIPLSGIRYRLYVFIWCRLFPIRYMILRGKSVVKRIKIKK